MRSTRIRLAATAALAALASPRQRKTLFILVAAGLLAIVAGCNSGDDAAKNDPLEPTQDVFARAGGWIAFRNGTKIVAVDPENAKDTLVLADDTLVPGPQPDDDPIAWSADGTKLLLRSREPELLQRPFYGDLFVLHPDGSRTTLLPEPEANSFRRWRPPTWGSFSPDGTEVTYASTGGSRDPYIIDADGGKPRPLGRLPYDEERPPEAAAWSPDGSSIAWFDFVERSATYGHHASVLSFVNPDGTALREEVAPLPGGGRSLVWSPDGSRLAFGDGDLEHPGQIFVINADGSGLRQVTREGENHWPAWSPDGSRIAFVHNGTLSTIAPDGTDMQTIERRDTGRSDRLEPGRITGGLCRVRAGPPVRPREPRAGRECRSPRSLLTSYRARAPGTHPCSASRPSRYRPMAEPGPARSIVRLTTARGSRRTKESR